MAVDEKKREAIEALEDAYKKCQDAWLQYHDLKDAVFSDAAYVCWEMAQMLKGSPDHKHYKFGQISARKIRSISAATRKSA